MADSTCPQTRGPHDSFTDSNTSLLPVSIVAVIGGHPVATYDDPDRADQHAERINAKAGFDAVAVDYSPPSHNPPDDAIDSLTDSALGH